MLDLRSDTVTKPGAAMRTAMANAEVGDDVLDGDPTAIRLERTVAELMGKEAGLFFPTGTMANQAAIWVHTRPGTEILVDAESHIMNWEMAGAAALCGVQTLTVTRRGSVIHASDIARALRPSDSEAPEPTLICVENTHNGAGGAVTPLAEMREIAALARMLGLRVHLDGARLWNAAMATGVSLADFAACADTVMVSFTKGLGAPVGAMIVGSADAIWHARRARKRFGGGMRQVGILAAGALYGVENNLMRLVDDHEAAKRLAVAVDGAAGAVVIPPDTNIVMIDLPVPRAEDVTQRATQLGVRVSAWSPWRVRAVTHLDAPLAMVVEAAPLLRQAIEEALA